MYVRHKVKENDDHILVFYLRKSKAANITGCSIVVFHTFFCRIGFACPFSSATSEKLTGQLFPSSLSSMETPSSL